MMRSSNYARTPPEAPEGLAVLVARLVVVVIMARKPKRRLSRRQRVRDEKSAPRWLNPTAVSRHKLAHEPFDEPSQPFRTSRDRRAGPHWPSHHAARRGADARLHAGRHRRRHEGRALAR